MSIRLEKSYGKRHDQPLDLKFESCRFDRDNTFVDLKNQMQTCNSFFLVDLDVELEFLHRSETCAGPYGFPKSGF